MSVIRCIHASYTEDNVILVSNLTKSSSKEGIYQYQIRRLYFPLSRSSHTKMYHLLLLLERLQRGDNRTDMDAFHSLLYKHNYTTTAKKSVFIFHDGSVPREKRGSVSNDSKIKRCDFKICTHFDKIDPRTEER